jgi:hypothetical protein
MVYGWISTSTYPQMTNKSDYAVNFELTGKKDEFVVLES